MAKNSTHKLLIIMLLLMLLMFLANTSLVPAVNAAELNPQENAVSVLKDVIGINPEEYTTSQDVIQLDSKFDGYPQIETSVFLASEEGSLRVTCSYVNGNLKLVYLSDMEGEMALKQPVDNTVEMAKNLLKRYQNYTGDSFYGDFASMLEGINTKTDLTKYVGNVKFEVSGSDQNNITYKWTYIDDNGVLA